MSERLSVEVLGRGGGAAQLPERGRLVIGSDPERAGLLIEGQGVAGVHCTIGRLKGGGWALRDLGSEYGTLVNGARVESARLRAGDQLVIGSVRLAINDPARPAGASAPAPGRPPAAVAAPEPARAPRAERPRSAAPPELPGYRLERQLGRGATGEVWLATQESLHRRVAVKLLSASSEADASFVDRFQAEARAAAALNHPNVVTVHDVGEHQGHHFLTMEFMAAGCLESRLAALGPIPWREALGLLLDAARGLVYAESRGVVHRDIKPANLMQTEDGITKICDLGLAVQLEAEGVESEGRRVVGTPHFMAPEVVRGQRADARSDLFSLGATAYRLLSGRTPFAGETTREILRGVLGDDPEPLDELVPGLPRAVARLIERLLEKDPDLRPPSAAVVARELEALRASDGQPAATSLTRARRPRAWWPHLAGAGAIVLAAIGARAILGGDGAQPDDPPGGAGPGASVAAPGPGGPEAVAGGNVAPPVETGPEGPPDEGGGDEEAGERMAELLARNAYLELGEIELTEDERLARLFDIAERYQGTDTARVARAEAEALRDELARRALAESARGARLAELEATLRAAAFLGASPPRVGDGLRGLRAAPGLEEWAGDPDYLRLRGALEGELLDAGLAWLEERWRRAGELEQDGDFAGLVEELRAILAASDLPEFPDGAPPEVVRMREIAGLARERRGRLDELENTFREEREEADRRAIAAAVWGPTRLEGDLARLDLAAAEERLRATAAELVTESARAALEHQRADVGSARGALTALRESWDRGEWKRRTISDPRPGRGNSEVAGVEAAGLRLAGEGANDIVPWSAWGARVTELDNLFHRRLEREWSADERGAIADLLALQAVVAVVRSVVPVLDGTSRGPFTESEAERALEPFDTALEWARGTANEAAVEAERHAAERLVAALRARSDGLWAVAAAHFERMLEEHGESLLVRLLSDGTPWQAAPEVPEPPEPPGPVKDEVPGEEQRSASGNGGD